MGFGLALLVAAVSGFIALSYEILWYRVVAFASWGLPSAFGLLLAAYLFGLAIGSRVSGWFCKDGEEARLAPRSLRPLAIFAFLANLMAWLVVPFFGWSAQRWHWPAALGLVAVAAALLGAILPLVSHFAIPPDDRAGQRLSYVYLANIVGSGAGSLLTGFVFLDLWPIATVSAVIGVTGLFLVALIVALVDRSPLRWGVIAALVGLSFAVLPASRSATDRLWERLLFKAKFTPETRFAEVIETKSGVITVTQDGVVFGGGAYDGKFNTSIVHDRNGILRAYAIGALSPAPRRVLMIGLASGSWATVVQHLPGLEHLTIVEINPGYTKLIAGHPEVAGLLHDPKVDIVIDDGRRWLHRHPGTDPDARFDVIVMNTTWHWRAHITNLLSQEFMQLARAHLAPGGLFYFNTTSSDDVQKTAATVFPHAMRVYNFMAVSDAPLTFDKTRWERTLAEYRIDGAPAIDRSAEDGRRLFEELVAYADRAHGPPTEDGLESRNDILARTATARVVTDDNMAPEWTQVFRFQDPP